MFQLKTPLWEHQKEAVKRAGHQYALFFEMGTGKTLTQIALLIDKYNDYGGVIPTLILCPLVVVPNWKREFLNHSNIPEHKIVLLQGPEKKRFKLLDETFTTFGTDVIVISNYESLRMKTVFDAYSAWRPDILVFDESHKLKSHNSLRSKLATKLADRSKSRYLLSGTPVLNCPMDLFSQYRVMDLGCALSKNFYTFRAKYFFDANAHMPAHIKFPAWKLKPRAVEEINRIVNETSMRVTKEQCLDLPPLVRQTEEVPMTGEQARMYKQMKDHFITYLNESACVAQLAITKGLRLMQIVSGFVKLENGKENTLSATPREAALYDLLELLTPNHKVIVWAVFRHNFFQIKKVCEKLGVEYVEVHGSVSPTKKQEAIDAFTSDPRCRVFVGHPGAGGIGVNLTVSDYSIYFSRSFSLEHDLQSEARNHRGGSEQHKKITRIDLVTPGTIDELVLKMLAKKQKLGEELLQAIRDGEQI